MKRLFYTQKGSIYVQVVEEDRQFWYKQQADGLVLSLAGGIHIPQSKLTELVSEYPRTLLDRTFCFDADVEREFFEDARREQHFGPLGNESTVIFFLIKHDDNRFGIGCSSPVVRIEEKM